MSNCSKDRQLLFIRPQGELAVAGFAKVKAAAAGKFKNLARDLSAKFLDFEPGYFQFRKIKDDCARAS